MLWFDIAIDSAIGLGATVVVVNIGRVFWKRRTATWDAKAIPRPGTLAEGVSPLSGGGASFGARLLPGQPAQTKETKVFNLTDFTITARNKAMEAKLEIENALKAWEAKAVVLEEEEKEKFQEQKQHLQAAWAQLTGGLAFLHHSEGNTTAAEALQATLPTPDAPPK